MKQTHILTPFGIVPVAKVRRLMETAGLVADKKNRCFNILMEPCEYWHLNKADDRKYNEKKWYKKKGYLPLRYNNFKVAMLEHDDDIEKALEMCETFYFRNGKPVYLPDYLAEIKGIDPSQLYFTYGRIFREWSTIKLT